MTIRNFIKKYRHKTKQGLTSIELVVVFGIFAALATSVLFSYRDFNTNIKLSNLTQDIALQIRQAQNKSVSGQSPQLFNGQEPPALTWAPSYGVYFSRDEDLNNQFVLFFDRNTQAISDPQEFDFGDKRIPNIDISCSQTDTDSECYDLIQITSGEKIDSICFDEFTYGVCDSADDAHIVFVRPLQRAYLSHSGMPEGEFKSDVSIYLESPTGSKSVVRVTATGQIIVE